MEELEYPKALYLGDTVTNEMVIVQDEDEEAQALVDEIEKQQVESAKQAEEDAKAAAEQAAAAAPAAGGEGQ